MKAEEIAKGALRIEWRDTESQARSVAYHAEELLADTKRTGEPLVRFCPECGGIGEVEPPARDCCPDGSAARYVPQKFAEACRATFKLAIAPAAPLGAHASGNDVEQHMQAIDEVMALPLLAPERGAIASALMASFMAGQQAQRDREAATVPGDYAQWRMHANGMYGLLSEIIGKGALRSYGDEDLDDRLRMAIANHEQMCDAAAPQSAATVSSDYVKHLEQRIADLHTQLHAETARLDYIEANWFDQHGADPAKGEPEGFEWAFGEKWEYTGTQSLRTAIDNEIALAAANPRDDTPVGDPVVTAADLAKVAHLPVDDWKRDDELTQSLLGLAGVEADLELIESWTDAQVRQAEEWAGATHLRASDNDDVEVPARPAFLPEEGGA
jgi:hypothetical protein